MGIWIPRRSTKRASVGKYETREENLAFSRTSTRSSFLESEPLIQSGHRNVRIGEPGGEAGHDALFAVNEESIFWSGLLMPGEQFRLIRVR
jgi:hypothetical protein